MTCGLLRLLLVLCYGNIAAAFDSVYKMTIMSSDPEQAREFLVTYLGANYEFTVNSSGCAHFEWTNLSHTTGTRLAFEMHLVKDWTYPNGGMSEDELLAKLEKIHGGMRTFDSFMDYHITLATDDLDPFVANLMAANKPLLVRQFRGNYSLFVEVPHGIIIEIVSPKLTVLKPKEWNRCGMPQRPTAVDQKARAAFPRLSKAKLPLVRPIRAVYASTAPAKEADFFVRHFGGERIVEQDMAEGALGPGNGTCYDVQVVRLRSSSNAPVTAITAFEMWWINSPRERQAEYTIAQHEKFLRAVHANISHQYDVFMDNHIGLWYGQADAFVQQLRREGIPFFSSGLFGAGPTDPHVLYTGIFVEGPSGQIYEMLALNQTVLPLKPSWDTITCGGHGGGKTSALLV